MPHESKHSIIEALHGFIQNERRRNFSFLAQHSHYYMHQQELLVVSQADSDDVEAVRKAAGCEISKSWEDWFTFSEPLQSDGFTRTVAIEITPGDDITVENMTIIEFGRRTQNMRDAVNWLRDTYEDRHELVGARFSEMRYEEQRLWWEGTGQVFRLLDLPAEMREATYLQILGPIVVPEVITYPTKKMVIGFGQSINDSGRIGRNRDPDIMPPNMRIMRTCRQVHAEATKVAYRDTTKRFTTIAPASAHLGTLLGPQFTATGIYNSAWLLAPDASFLSHVQLERSAAEYFDFIGIHPLRDRPFAFSSQSPIHISALQNFTSLQTLDFRFISPKHPRAFCPWSVALGHPRNETHACQKKWIDIFFVFAWPYLQALSKVKFSLSGCVKNSSCVYWKQVLNDKKADHTSTIRAEKAKMFNMNVQEEVFECKCTNSCVEVGVRKAYHFSEYEIRRCEGLREEVDKAYWDFED
jgi:hypothetical protein